MASRFKQLEVWRQAMDLARLVYASSKRFPHDEKYGLRSQLRRAAVSVPSNISEGHARRSKLEYRQFAVRARGSLAEVETQVILSNDFRFIDDESASILQKKIESVGRLLNGLIRYLNREIGD